jgi:hypothetical protein
MADKLSPLSQGNLNDGVLKGIEEGTIDDMEDGVYKNYLYFFKINTFYTK